MKRQISTEKFCGNCPCVDREGSVCCLYERSLKFYNFKETKMGGEYIRLDECIEDNPKIIKMNKEIKI